MSANGKSRRRLYGFILFNVIEEAIIAIIAFIILHVFMPSLLIPGMIIVAIGLVIFTLVKIYSYWTSANIPVYDPLIGQEGVALTEFRRTEGEYWEGQVLVRGEYWRAKAEVAIPQNTRILVLSLSGLTLVVGMMSKKPQSLEEAS